MNDESLLVGLDPAIVNATLCVLELSSRPNVHVAGLRFACEEGELLKIVTFELVLRHELSGKKYVCQSVITTEMLRDVHVDLSDAVLSFAEAAATEEYLQGRSP